MDQYIYQSAAGTVVDATKLKGTLDVVVSGSTLTFTLTNLSPDAAFVGGGAPATMLLTGFGVQLPGVDILSGTVSVNGTAVNFDVGQSTTNISNQWLYANAVIDGYGMSGVLAVDSIVSSVNNGGGTRFAGPPPVNINGPDYGAISALESEYGASQPGVRNSIQVVLNLSAAAPSFDAINAGNVVLAFGSPTLVGLPNVTSNAVPEPSSIVLLGLGALGAGAAARRRKQQVA